MDANPANSSSSVSPAVLGRLLDAHGAGLALYARQLCDAAEDVVQEAFIELARLRALPENPPAWLYRTVRNKALAAGRAAGRRRKAHETAAAQERESTEKARFVREVDNSLDGQAIARALAELPDEDCELVVAHLWGGLTFREIGELLGISDSAAHRRYRAALEQLRMLTLAGGKPAAGVKKE